MLCADCGRFAGRRIAPETLVMVRRILGGELRAALAEPPGADHGGDRTPRPLAASSTTSSAGSAAPRSSELRRRCWPPKRALERRQRPRLGSPSGMAKNDLMDRVVNLAKRRGLVFPSSEIYGGFRSTWDYGPLGVLLKRNVKDAWWRSMVQLRDDVVGLDSAILMAPKVWEASGHVATFTDPLVDCRNCKERFRADQLPESGACPNCGMKDTFTEARNFNLMFKTYVGPVEDDASVAYLRPETAQGIFVNFANVQTTTRKKPPFGIAQIGKSFRNEITPGNFVFRTREFEQMEMEFFVPPEDGAAVVRVLVPGALPLVHRPRHPRGQAAPAPARDRGAVALLRRHLRRGVHVPVGLGRARGHRQPHRLRPHPAQQVLRPGPQLLRPGARPPLPAARDRAGRGRRPRHARLPARGLRGGGRRQRQGRHREAHGAAPPPAPGADQGRGAAAVEERAAGAGGRRGGRRCCGRS